jgi:glycosyltransferase involved in cell wall biosynthesis
LILENPLDAESLAAMIRSLFEDAGLREKLARNAAQTAAQFTWESNARRMRELFESAMAARRDRQSAHPAK